MGRQNHIKTPLGHRKLWGLVLDYHYGGDWKWCNPEGRKGLMDL